MSFKHILIAVLVAALWGFNFVAIRLGVDEIPPLLLAMLRFSCAALPALVLPRPKVPWPLMIAIGMTLFLGQFALLFPAIQVGMPPGLASTTLQAQAFFTFIFAAVLIGERPHRRQWLGMAIAASGLFVIALTTDGIFTWAGLVLTLLAAASWALGNVLLRQAGKVDMLAMAVWLSLIPPLPLLALSLAVEGWPAISLSLASISPLGLFSVFYLAVPATVLAYSFWGFLIKSHSASVVAPFSLLVPVFGTLSAYLVLGETFPPLRLAGMLLILAGLAAIALPLPRRWRQRPVS
ncbi:EamA family transporter [Pseudohoeflea sp. DP4N28-3]|uniref:EamA family transporter n=2 Tax=Pseudohoeflea coraliihabitans TaxID=2860393 RepID=A0ABS6WSR2_9HYPH|nr:EamA family transporter [Pseudohoeflea sp. DP4N28-3]